MIKKFTAVCAAFMLGLATLAPIPVVAKEAGDIDCSNGFGYALQVGLDDKIDDKWHRNADLKKIFLNTDINVNNGVVIVDDADVDPWIFGVGYRF